MKYLLDTNICIFWLRKQQTIVEKILNIGLANCCISEITFAELLFGEELAIMKGGNKYKKQPLQEFLSKVSIFPIKPAIELYAKEKSPASMRRHSYYRRFRLTYSLYINN